MAESRSLAPIWKNLPADPKAAAPALLKAFLEGRKDSTFRTYRQGLEAFRDFLGLESVDAASGFLLSKRPGDANKIGLDFKNFMIRESYAAGTINNRLAALRSLVHLAKTIGIVTWSLEVEGVREEKYRDTAGPGFDKIIATIKTLQTKDSPKAARDAVIVALMGLMGLRRKEVVGLNMEDFEPENARLFILGKGRSDQEPLTIPDPLIALFKVWIGRRGAHPGPLFTHFRQAKMIGRLSERSVGRITNGLDLGHAHGLRHSAITKALDESNGDVRKVARFSRHKNLDTLMKYDDNRRDLGGDVAKGLADNLK